MSEWVRVEDGLPEECKKVIVWIDRYNYYPDYMDMSSRQNGVWTSHDGAWQRISHWQYLPERPTK